MKIAIRADGDSEFGMGHVYRQLNIADSLAGNDIVFFIEYGEPAVKIVSEKGFAVKKINKNNELKEVSNFNPETIIIDKLATEKNYMQKMKKICKVLVTFDNTGQGADCADLVFNVLYEREWQKGDKFFTGPKYIVLNKIFDEYNREEKKIWDVKNILVTQGGGDSCNATPRILSALNKIEGDFKITVVIGPAFKNKGEIKETIKKIKKNYKITENTSEMAKLIYSSDLAISSGGITLYEIVSVGTPAVVLYSNSREKETAERLEKEGTALCIGSGFEFDEKNFIAKIKKIINDKRKREQMSKKGKEMVDGKGVYRVKEKLMQGLGNKDERFGNSSPSG